MVINQRLELVNTISIILASLAEIFKQILFERKSKVLNDQENKSIVISSDSFVVLNYLNNIDHPIFSFIKQFILNATNQLAIVDDNNIISTTIILSSILIKKALYLLEHDLDIGMIVYGFKKSLELITDSLNNHIDNNINNSNNNHLILNIEINQSDKNNENNDNILDKIHLITNQSNVKESEHDDWKYLLNQQLVELLVNQLKSLDWIDRFNSVQFIKINPTTSLQQYLPTMNGNKAKMISFESDSFIIPIIPCSVKKEIHDNVKIQLYQCNIDSDSTSSSSEKKSQMDIVFDTIDKLERWRLEEENIYKDWVSRLVSCGVNVIMVTGDVNKIALYYLNRSGIVVFKNVNISTLKLIATKLGTNSIQMFNIENNQNNNNQNNQNNTIATFKSILKYKREYMDFKLPHITTIVINSDNNLQYQEIKKYSKIVMNYIQILSNNNQNNNNNSGSIQFIKNIKELQLNLSQMLSGKSELEMGSIRFPIQQYSKSLEMLSQMYSDSYIRHQSNLIELDHFKHIFKISTELICLLLNVDNLIESKSF